MRGKKCSYLSKNKPVRENAVTEAYLPSHGFRSEGEIPRRDPTSSRLYIGKYLQVDYTVSMPAKISICLIRGRMELLGNDEVSVVYALNRLG